MRVRRAASFHRPDLEVSNALPKTVVAFRKKKLTRADEGTRARVELRVRCIVNDPDARSIAMHS